MKNIYVATQVRGFFQSLFNTEFEGIVFSYNDSALFDVINRRRNIGSKLIRSKILDLFGFYQEIGVKANCDLAFSYNRFVKKGTDYVLYLENPLALVHYSTSRARSIVTKKKLKKSFSNPNLKAIVCMSESCKDTLYKLYNIPQDLDVRVIYPLVNNTMQDPKINEEKLRCLFIASQFEIKGGREVIELFKQLNNLGISPYLKIITPVSMLDKKYIDEISSLKNIELLDFNLSRSQLNEAYINNDILLNPSRQDSFPLVLLEALAYGNVLVASDLFAVSEMIESNINGFLLDPLYRFFSKDKTPNEKVWNDRKSTIYSDYIDETMVKKLLEIFGQFNDKDYVQSLKDNSIKLYNDKFHHLSVKREWNELFMEIFE